MLKRSRGKGGYYIAYFLWMLAKGSFTADKHLNLRAEQCCLRAGYPVLRFACGRAKLKVGNRIYTGRLILFIKQVVQHSCQFDCVIDLEMRIYFELGMG